MRIGLAFLLSCVWVLSLGAQTVKVATYNIENYLSTDRTVRGVYRKDYPKPEAEKAEIFKVIKEEAPDVLCIQEIGDNTYFKEFLEELKNRGLEYPYSTHSTGSDKTRYLAVLSKIPFEDVKKHTQIKYTGKGDRETEVLRGLIEVHFKTEGIPWRLYGLHLKSKRTVTKDDYQARSQRLGEAVAIRDIIDKDTTAQTKYLVVGDFNDEPKSKTLKRFYRKGKRDLTNRLDAQDSRNERWTHYYAYQHDYSTVDHILASLPIESLLKLGSPKVNDSAGALEGSDHRMVSAEFEFYASSKKSSDSSK